MEKTKNKTYSVEFKEAAVKRANESDLPVSETARNLGVNVNTLFTWIQKYSQPIETEKVKRGHEPLYEEVKRLKKENARLTQERDILKKRRRTLPASIGKVRLDSTTYVQISRQFDV